ncbi:lysozyme inhibitor LprI family protein [Paraburkholderia sp. BCC1884]|uniref:lysozyme inhibitor LprI family protein n=1 Tax=Paraburkholderia sp. BCC1884 TaxID=2562668 RepID=UPI001182AD5D|nr:hypothetical protein [Paraburkholderia sp. BCC1884]
MLTFNIAFLHSLQRADKPFRWLSIGVLAASAMLASQADAASFKCTGKLSASEQIVCKDPALSALDDRLAIAWRHAKDTTLDSAALESARTQQWLWRQHNCTDQACVKSWYDRRIAELDADYAQATHARDEAFDASLAMQNLAPSAADAVRKMNGRPVADEKTASTR